MSLVLEDGTGRIDADSYASLAELTDYAGRYGVSLPASDLEREVLLRRAAQRMGAMLWKGCRAIATQGLDWPRDGAARDGRYLPANSVPAAIKAGQMALAAELYADDQAPPTDAKGPIVREKIDVLETEYATPRVIARPQRTSAVLFGPFLRIASTHGLALRRA